MRQTNTHTHDHHGHACDRANKRRQRDATELETHTMARKRRGISNWRVVLSIKEDHQRLRELFRRK